MTVLDRIAAWLHDHPDDAPRVRPHGNGYCMARRLAAVPRWQRVQRGGSTAQVIACRARASMILDDKPRCPTHVLQGLEGRDP